MTVNVNTIEKAIEIAKQAGDRSKIYIRSLRNGFQLLTSASKLALEFSAR